MFTADVISAQEAEKLKMVMHVYTKEDLKNRNRKNSAKNSSRCAYGYYVYEENVE